MPEEQKSNGAAESRVWGVISQLGLNKVQMPAVVLTCRLIHIHAGCYYTTYVYRDIMLVLIIMAVIFMLHTSFVSIPFRSSVQGMITCAMGLSSKCAMKMDTFEVLTSQ